MVLFVLIVDACLDVAAAGLLLLLCAPFGEEAAVVAALLASLSGGTNAGTACAPASAMSSTFKAALFISAVAAPVTVGKILDG